MHLFHCTQHFTHIYSLRHYLSLHISQMYPSSFFSKVPYVSYFTPMSIPSSPSILRVSPSPPMSSPSPLHIPQADPSSVDPNKLSPNRPRSHHGRSMSVQSSSVDPLGSNGTLSSSASSEMDSGRHSSEGAIDGRASPMVPPKES